jgi:hypothetical protein
MQSDTLVEARRRAEQAVSDMADPALKVKAFEVILNKLLSGGESSETSRSRSRKRAPNLVNVSGRKEENSKRGRILQLRDGGFFDEARTISDVRDALRDRGWLYNLTSLSGPLQSLVQSGQLRRALSSDGNKKIFKYVNP